MLYTFNDLDKGTEYIEFQLCKERNNDEIFNNIHCWNEESLYLKFCDYEQFIKIFGDLFSKCVHADLSIGGLDLYGVNYLPLNEVVDLRDFLLSNELKAYNQLLDFVISAIDNNGLYILGL